MYTKNHHQVAAMEYPDFWERIEAHAVAIRLYEYQFLKMKLRKLVSSEQIGNQIIRNWDVL